MSLPQRIHLIRHGESIANLDRTIYATIPDHAVPLSDHGRTQAQTAGLALGEDLDAIEAKRQKLLNAFMAAPPSLGVYLSPYTRTQDTWAEMLPGLLPTWAPRFVREDVRLREQEWSANPTAAAANNKALTWEEAEAYGAFWYRHPSGESMADALLRCQSFWTDFHRDCEDAESDTPSDILIITHGIALRLLIMAKLRWTVDQFYTVAAPPNCAWYTLQLDWSGRYTLKTPLPVREVGESKAV